MATRGLGPDPGLLEGLFRVCILLLWCGGRGELSNGAVEVVVDGGGGLSMHLLLHSPPPPLAHCNEHERCAHAFRLLVGAARPSTSLREIRFNDSTLFESILFVN